MRADLRLLPLRLALMLASPDIAKAGDTLGLELGSAPCSRLSTVPFANGPKRSMGHALGAEKNNFFYSRY